MPGAAVSVAVRLVLALAAVAALGVSWGRLTSYYEQRGYQRRDSEVWLAAAADAETNARETLRRLARQQEDQRVHDAQLAAARADAARNADAADGLRQQNARLVNAWRAALADPAAGVVCPAAGDALGVLADVLSRADRRAGVLAAAADAAHAAGAQCEADYDALTRH